MFFFFFKQKTAYEIMPSLVGSQMCIRDRNEGGIDEQQSELIQNAIEFSELEAFDVLTPRVDVEAIDIDNTKEEIRELFLETGFSRLPVYEDTIDKIMGVLNQKDFHNYILHSSKNVSEYVKTSVFNSG